MTREGTLGAHGRYGVEAWLETYSAHPYEHAGQLRESAGLPPARNPEV